MANYIGIGDMTAEEWSKLKDQKVSIGLVSIVAALLWQVYGWADTTFVTRLQADEKITSLQASVERTNQLLVQYIGDESIRDAKERVRELEVELYHLDVHMEAHGSTPKTELRRTQVNGELRVMKEYRDCLLRNGPNCKHLANGG